MVKEIGIDINTLTRSQRTGVERYVFLLIRAMMNVPLKEGERVTLYGRSFPDDLGTLPEGWRFVRLRWPLKKGWTHGRLSLRLLVNPPDVFFAPGHEIPVFHRSTKIVTTLHDLAGLTRPELYPAHEGKRHAFAVRKALVEADLLFAPSQATADDIRQFAKKNGLSAPDIRVTPLAPADSEQKVSTERRDAILSGVGLKLRKYVLYVGRIERKKNTQMLAELFAEDDIEGLSLVMVGKEGFDSEVTREIAERSSGRVKMMGFVDDETLGALYDGAFAFAFPTHYEGFGMPLLEAMRRGVPVISSQIQVLEEVGGEVAIYCPPDEPKSWILALRNLMANGKWRVALGNEGKRHAKSFTWEACAQATMEGLRSLL